MTRRRLAGMSYIFAFVGLNACTSAPPAGQAVDAIAIRHVTVIPMTGAAPTPLQTVLIRDGRIAAVGPDAGVPVPAGATVVDGRGKYLIPGLFDMHSHMSKVRASGLGIYAFHGVTTIRDVGSEPAEVLRWRQEVRTGTRVGPRMLIAGPYLESLRNIQRMRGDPPESRVEPFERARIPIASPADAKRIIDSLSVFGFDHLKIRTVQDEATYRAIIAAAHAHGLKLVGHAVASSAEILLDAGQDGIEHNMPQVDEMTAEQRQAFWRQLASRDIGVVPTLVVATHFGVVDAEYFRKLIADSTASINPLRPYVSKFLLLDWSEQASETSPELQAYFRQLLASGLNHMREMHAAGVRIMTGTDVGVLNIFPGASLHDELQLFVDSVGMKPMDALIAATRKPAEFTGIADSVGTIAQGKVADLVLLDGNPLENISNTRRINSVLLRGKLMRRNDLDALLTSVKSMPDIRTNDWVR